MGRDTSFDSYYKEPYKEYLEAEKKTDKVKGADVQKIINEVDSLYDKAWIDEVKYWDKGNCDCIIGFFRKRLDKGYFGSTEVSKKDFKKLLKKFPLMFSDEEIEVCKEVLKDEEQILIFDTN